MTYPASSQQVVTNLSMPMLQDYDRLKQVLDSIDDGILVIDRERRVLFANRAALAYHDSSHRNPENTYCYELASTRRCTECFQDCIAKRVFESGESKQTIRVFQNEEEFRQYYEIYASPLYGTEGDVAAVVQTIRNVTHQHELEIHLKNTESLAILGRIAAGVVHEVNSSMASIATCVEGLLRAFNNPEIEDLRQLDYLPRYLETMKRSVYRCKNSLGDALRLVREEDLYWERVDVHEVLQSVLPLVCYEAEQVNKEVRIQWAERVEPIWADGKQLARVFINLVHNALDAIKPGVGHVQVSTRAIPNGIQVVIMDTGCGILPEHRNRVFEPFFTTKPSGKGTGLGLPISLQILDRHRAKLALESELGIGTTVWVDLLNDPRECL